MTQEEFNEAYKNWAGYKIINIDEVKKLINVLGERIVEKDKEIEQLKSDIKTYMELTGDTDNYLYKKLKSK